MVQMINGMKVNIIPAPKPVKRTWRERLFTRPWRPFQTHRIVEHPMWQELCDTDRFFHIGDTLHMTERQWSALREYVDGDR